MQQQAPIVVLSPEVKAEVEKPSINWLLVEYLLDCCTLESIQETESGEFADGCPPLSYTGVKQIWVRRRNTAAQLMAYGVKADQLSALEFRFVGATEEYIREHFNVWNKADMDDQPLVKAVKTKTVEKPRPDRHARSTLKYYVNVKQQQRLILPKNRRTICNILEGYDCPRSLAVWLMFYYNEHDQLVNLDCRSQDYADPAQFRDAYGATLLLSKADFLNLHKFDPEGKPIGKLDTREVALEKFFQAEDACRARNRLFAGGLYKNRDSASALSLSLDRPEDRRMLRLVQDMQFEVQRILDGERSPDGEVNSDFDPNEWVDSCSWGPGATASISGVDTSAANKFQIESGITVDLYDLIGPLFPAVSPLWAGRLGGKFSFEMGSRVLTVPKNAKTDRVIAAEPGLNSFFQLGIGKMISNRLLRRAGIDLTTQERNGLLCFYASMSGNLATVDFSAASDTISREVVRYMLPEKWYQVLDACRSRYGYVDGKWHYWEKFSSMGNGFTFPLQSLLFVAAAVVACKSCHLSSDYVGVFGDDVILPVGAYKTFVELSAFCGFTVNLRKSFSDGYFRESCGTHYYHGLDCKPIYYKERLANALDIYKMANAVRRLAHRHNSNIGCRASFRPAWRFLRNQIPEEYRFWIPEGFGDGGFVGNFDEARPDILKARNWVEGWWVHAIESKGEKRESTSIGLYLDRLFSRSETEHRNSYSLRVVTRKQITRFLVARWYELGSWL